MCFVCTTYVFRILRRIYGTYLKRKHVSRILRRMYDTYIKTVGGFRRGAGRRERRVLLKRALSAQHSDFFSECSGRVEPAFEILSNIPRGIKKRAGPDGAGATKNKWNPLMHGLVGQFLVGNSWGVGR